MENIIGRERESDLGSEMTAGYLRLASVPRNLFVLTAFHIIRSITLHANPKGSFCDRGSCTSVKYVALPTADVLYR